MSKQLAELLLKEKIISLQDMDAADKNFKSTNEAYFRFFVKNKMVNEKAVMDLFSKRYSIPSFDLNRYQVPEDVVGLLDRDQVNRFNLVPVQKAKGTLVVALADPTSLQFLDDIKFSTQLKVEAVITSFTAIDNAIEKYYGVTQDLKTAVEEVNTSDSAAADVEEVILNTDDAVDISGVDEIEAPIIQLVNSILIDSIKKKASDIHIEPYETTFRIRFRIDGNLYDVLSPPVSIRAAVVARIKIMSRMDIAEKRLPQDGRIKIKTQYGEMDYRVNSMPTVHGEKIVLRLLDKSGLQADMHELGFTEQHLKLFKNAIHESFGMVLVTGPTGSGKTTTLYSALQELNDPKTNISTAEDPVEYNIEGINQLQTHADIGLNFAQALRAFMRQDPDVILVGEIRDFETAEVAIQAALTGHLVLSTVHTNDAPSTITRLLNMGIEPFLVTAAVHLIVAQRLMRRICPACKTEQKIAIDRIVKLGVDPVAAKNMKLYKGAGCDECANTGYAGRFGVYEVMPFTPSLKEAVLSGVNSIELKKLAIAEGMQTLRMAALQKVSDGITTLEEALTHTSSDL